MDVRPGRLSPAFLISQKSEIFDSFPPGEAFGCGGGIGLRPLLAGAIAAGHKAPPYGEGRSAIVVVGAPLLRCPETAFRADTPEGCPYGENRGMGSSTMAVVGATIMSPVAHRFV